jgi:transcriptional regulator with XRE-family HTH domain
METLRKRLQLWMKEIMLAKGWSAERWAKEADTSATNITRFLSGNDQPIPSTLTLEKLANACGVSPPIGVGKRSFKPIPIVDATSIRLIKWPAKTQELNRLMDQRVGMLQAPHETSDDAFAIVVQSDRLSMLGIVPGDQLVIEPNGERTTGAVLVFVCPDGRVDVGVLEGKMLTARSTTLHVGHAIDDVSIVGRATQHVKKL